MFEAGLIYCYPPHRGYIDTLSEKAETISNSIGNNIEDILHKFNLYDIVHMICTNRAFL